MAQEKPQKDWKKGWKLYYWQRFGGANGVPFGGRGAPVRVMFELAGVEWEEACAGKNPVEVGKEILGVNAKSYPNFAFPVVAHDSGITVSQSTNILLFLGEVLGLAPDDVVERALANQVQLTVYDALSEGGNKRQEVNKDDQKSNEQKQTVLNEFYNGRFASFLELIEAQLKRNGEGKGWFFGNKVTFADIQVADLLRRYELGAPDHYKDCKFKVLKEHHKRFENLDKVKAFYASNRCPKPNGWLG